MARVARVRGRFDGCVQARSCRLEALCSQPTGAFQMTSLASPDQASDAIRLAPIPDVLAAIAAGQLVLDDADRENEADLIVAADKITPATMAMLIREGSGIVCLCIRPDQASRLK